MLDEKIISILVERIQNNKINPVTDKPFKIEDIKLDSYKAEVTKRLKEPTQQP